MKHNIFISIYRFDAAYIEFINQHYSDSVNTFSSLFELKNQGIKNLVKAFMSYRKYDEVVIVFNDENYFLVENLFYVLSLLIAKMRLYRIFPNKRIDKVTLSERVASVWKMIGSAVEIKWLVKATERNIKLQSDKHRTKLTEESRLFYLKTNLSFGTKAGGSLGHISGIVNAMAQCSNLTYISAEMPVMIDEAVNKEKINLQKVVYSIPYELNSLKVNKAFLDQTEKLIENNKPDVIYQRLTLFNYVGAYLSNKYRIPLIVEYNGSEVWVQKNWGGGLKYTQLALEMEEYMLKSADTIITVSEVLKEELIERGFDRDKIVFYPNCIDERVFDHRKYHAADKMVLRQQLGLKEDDKVFTFIGTFGAWHGVEFLAHTIVRLIEEHKDTLVQYKVKFLLIGDGLLGEKVRTIFGNEIYKPFVIFTGIIPQQEAPKYLSISDCFLSPHIKQKGKFIGSPTKLFEYMSFAKPIIASNLDQVGEVFEKKLFANDLKPGIQIEEESAIVFEPDDDEAFIKSILFVVSNKNIDKLGTNAHQMVMEKYTWDVHVDKIIEKYNSRQ